ncbi:hypothetical protein TNCV_1042631 [Trichonephila clavipes]|nr:hypothetical protein TNCV_1042631 [Trichonephila clavipes]
MRKERRRHDDENVGRTRLVLPEGMTGNELRLCLRYHDGRIQVQRQGDDRFHNSYTMQHSSGSSLDVISTE